MKRIVPNLSLAMLILGALLIVAGLGWALWVRVNAPPAPTITDEGALVLAVTAPSMAATQTTESAPSTELPPVAGATASLDTTPSLTGPTPELLPGWTITPALTESTPVSTSVPKASQGSTTPEPPTPAPSPTPVPPAQEPPVRIVAPAIELDAKVLPMGWEMVDREEGVMSEWKVPKRAAGWHMNSALPGHGDNVVLSGHHNIQGKVFRYVVDLEPGDEITLYSEGIPYTYYVTEKYILKEVGMPLEVQRRNAQWIMPTGDERLTLVTCWPYEWPGNSHRVIVVARPADSQAVIGGID